MPTDQHDPAAEPSLPLVPPVASVRSGRCCDCGGTGLTYDGDTCPLCDGLGHC